MISSDSSVRESVAEHRRRLVAETCPDENSSWIAQQVSLAVRGVAQAGSQAGRQHSTPRPGDTGNVLTSGRTRRALRVACLVVTGLAAVVIATAGRRWFILATVGRGGIISLAGAAVLTGAFTLRSLTKDRRTKVLSCRVRADSRFKFYPPAAGEMATEMVTSQSPTGTPVDDPSVVVARIKNTGGTPIEVADYVEPLRISFPQREVVVAEVRESDPPDLQDLISRDPDFQTSRDQIALPRIRLAPGSSYKLVVLLSGTRPGVKVKYAVDTRGRVRNGHLATGPNYRRAGRPTVLAGALTCLIVATLAVVLLINTVMPFTKPSTKPPEDLVTPDGLVCVPGTLTIEGSSAFGLAATKLADSYHAFCPGSNVNVRARGSLDGLMRLLDAPAADRQTRLVFSDGMAPEQNFPDLIPQPFAIVPFTFVANRKVPVTRLSREQVRNIFTGKVSRWSEVTGRPEHTAAIRVIGRSVTSGTRHTLERYVLGTPNAPVAQAAPTSDSCRAPRSSDRTSQVIVCEQASTSDLISRVAEVDYSIGYADVPDVKQAADVKQVTLDGQAATLPDIRAGYPFWTVEYMYSYGPLRSGSLASAFADYLNGAEGANTVAGFGYYSCRTRTGDMAADMGALCIPYRYS